MLLPFQGFLYMPALGFRIRQQRPLTDHSLSNIMYEKKISYSQGEVYEL